MGKTLVEKTLARVAGRADVKAGDHLNALGAHSEMATRRASEKGGSVTEVLEEYTLLTFLKVSATLLAGEGWV